MKKYNPIKTYIPIYGYYYAVVHIEELFEDKANFIGSSMINAYTSIFTLGIIYNAVTSLFM